MVVGGGISELSAAYFYRGAKRQARILVLDNHDDFGGHAKRNEIAVDGHTLLMNGGTFLIDSPCPYSAQATRLLHELGISPSALGKRYHEAPAFTGAKLRRGVFFGRELYGRDVLVAVPGGEEGYRSRGGSADEWAAALRNAPISEAAKLDIARVETEAVDFSRI